MQLKVTAKEYSSFCSMISIAFVFFAHVLISLDCSNLIIAEMRTQMVELFEFHTRKMLVYFFVFISNVFTNIVYEYWMVSLLYNIYYNYNYRSGR